MQMSLWWHILSTDGSNDGPVCVAIEICMYVFPLFALGCEHFKFKDRIINIRPLGKHRDHIIREEIKWPNIDLKCETTEKLTQKRSYRLEENYLKFLVTNLFASELETKNKGWTTKDGSETSCNRLAHKWLQNWDKQPKYSQKKWISSKIIFRLSVNNFKR